MIILIQELMEVELVLGHLPVTSNENRKNF